MTAVQYWTNRFPFPKLFKAQDIQKHFSGLLKRANMDPRAFVGGYIATPRQIALRNFPRKRSTDTLSFPYHDPLLSESTVDSTTVTESSSSSDWCLGEIIVCPERICKGRRHGLLIRRRLQALLTHGFVHLLGYDHHTREEWLQMRLVEKRLYYKKE